MAQFYTTFFLIGIVNLVYLTAMVESTRLVSFLTDAIFENNVRSVNKTETLLGGKTTSFKNWCSPAIAKSRFVTERKICQSYPVMNVNRCRKPETIFSARCCNTHVMNESLECREVFYTIEVQISNSCGSNDPKDYHKASMIIPITCVCVLPRSQPEPALVRQGN